MSDARSHGDDDRSRTGSAAAGGDGPTLHDAGLQIEQRWLVRRISMALPRGRFTVLIGPNRMGKSTVLRLLAGLWTPTEGRAELDGRALATLPRRDLARRIAVVPQDTHLGLAFRPCRETVAIRAATPTCHASHASLPPTATP